MASRLRDRARYFELSSLSHLETGRWVFVELFGPMSRVSEWNSDKICDEKLKSVTSSIGWIINSFPGFRCRGSCAFDGPRGSHPK